MGYSKSVVLFSYPKERPKTTQSTRNILKPDYIQWDNEEVLHRELSKPVVDKIQKKVKGNISFANQTTRYTLSFWRLNIITTNP